MLTTYRGSCHCGTVKFAVDLDLTQSSYRCNFSVCRRTRFWPAVVKPEGFRLLSGEAALTQYLFHTRKNQHYFCKHCGVRPFGIGNTPDGQRIYGVNLGCLENATPEELAAAPIVYIDGKHDRHTAPAITSYL